MKNFTKIDFNKAKREAEKLVRNGCDCSDIIESINSIRKTLGQPNREVTKSDIIQHLAIRIYKEKYSDNQAI